MLSKVGMNDAYYIHNMKLTQLFALISLATMKAHTDSCFYFVFYTAISYNIIVIVVLY